MKNDIFKFTFLLALLLLVECKTHQQDNNNSKYYSETKKVLKEKYFKSYTVTRIDSSLLNNQGRNDIYQIYAEKNDTIIKIISFKNKGKSKSRNKIHVNDKYNFTLITLNPDKYIDGGSGTTNISGSSISNSKGVYTLFNYEKSIIYDVFEATNLKGLDLINK